MKKQLKEELVALAEKISLLKERDEVAAGELKELAKRLYEQLTIYDFTESNLFEATEQRQREVVKTAQQVKAPAEKKQEKQAAEKKPIPEKQPVPVKQEVQENEDEYNPTGLEYNPEDITEPNTEKIKDIVAQMPPETQQIDDLFAQVESRNYKKNDMQDIGGVHYDNLPQFEPVSKSGGSSDKPRSVNDRLKKGINIGLNDRLAFVKHLFDGSTSDYNRVLSQLNTIKSKEEAFNFVANMVKPDYNNWEGKEDYESRFLTIIEKKFE